jgi:hypothetical protein
MNELELILRQLKLDTKYTAFLSRQLEYIKRKTYDVVYPEFKARRLVPVTNETDPGAETITYRQWDAFGSAMVISNYADDLPNIDVLVEEFTNKVIGLGAEYTWSAQDIRRAALAGNNLKSRKAMRARKSHELAVEEIAAKGDARTSLTGFGNNANVNLSTPITGGWATATGLQIAADMQKMTRDMVVTNKESFLPDTIALGTQSFQEAATKTVSTTGDSGKTALQYFLDSSPYIKDVESWYKLDDMNAGGTNERAVCYKRDPMVLELEMPQEYEEFPPQARGLSFEVPTHSRTGGVVVYYPLGMIYMDGLIT